MRQADFLLERPIAHRGYHDMNQSRWENSLSAFDAAVSHGFAIECDVLLSADGIPIVFHDRELGRLTGHHGATSARTADELTRMKIGGSDDGIPALSTMLEHVVGRVPLVIELKHDPATNPSAIAHAVLKELAGYEGKAALMSFRHEIVQALKFESEWPVGLTAEGDEDAQFQAHFDICKEGVDFVSYSIAQLDNPFTRSWRDEVGKPLIAWTVRNSMDLAKCHQCGAQATFEGFDIASDLANLS